MKRFCVFLFIVVACSQTLGLNLRSKRQTDKKEDELEDRYGWNRPDFGPISIQIQFPDEGENTWQNQIPGQRPNRFPSQRPVFPGPGQNQFPEQEQLPSTQPTNNSNNGNGQETSQSVQECIRTCPVTPEFRPVCGSNRVQYSNPGRLICAQMCGVSVNLWREAPCPSATTPSPV